MIRAAAWSCWSHATTTKLLGALLPNTTSSLVVVGGGGGSFRNAQLLRVHLRERAYMRSVQQYMHDETRSD